LRRRSESLRKGFESAVKDAEELARAPTGDPVTGWATLTEELERWKELLEPLRQGFSNLPGKLERDRQQFLEDYEARLARELSRRGLTVFGSTTPLVIDGVVHVEIDAKVGAVTVNGQAATELSLTSVCDEVVEKLSILKKGLTPPRTMLELLCEAHDREARLTGKDTGTQIPTMALLPHILLTRQTSAFRNNPSLRTFKEYTRYQYRADLHALMMSNANEIRGRKFRYASGSDTAGAMFMFVPELQRTAHVGRIWFDRV
jgi:hypothetical protein